MRMADTGGHPNLRCPIGASNKYQREYRASGLPGDEGFLKDDLNPVIRDGSLELAVGSRQSAVSVNCALQTAIFSHQSTTRESRTLKTPAKTVSKDGFTQHGELSTSRSPQRLGRCANLLPWRDGAQSRLCTIMIPQRVLDLTGDYLWAFFASALSIPIRRARRSAIWQQK